MPELPEVETVRRQLHARLAGATIREVIIWRLGRVQPAQGIESLLIGKKISGIQRRAKLLIWMFENGEALTAHLKMTGRFTFVDEEYQRQKHDRVKFVLRDDQQQHFSLVWSDIRQFGYLSFVSSGALKDICDAYGPEPLDVSPAVLAHCLSARSGRVLKVALLDQTAIAGIGNIYADEACHRAGLRPTRRLKTLTEVDRVRLARCIQSVLQASLNQKGTSAHDYLDTRGERGGFLALLRVYGRENKPCKTCKTSIKKIVLGQRGTHYCPTCQT